MTDVLLHEREQAAVRAIISTEPVPGSHLPGDAVIQHLARLITCDEIGIALLDSMGSTVREPAGGLTPDGDHPSSEGHALGVQQVDHTTTPTGAAAGRGVAVLALGVRNGPHHIVQLWMVRRTTAFTERDRALLVLVAPAVERILRVRPLSTLPPSLTVQERRVLLHVAEGLSNAEIAERLFVAPSTVRKHLEHAYRKLGVSNRLAAVHALQGSARDVDVRQGGVDARVSPVGVR
jgi:DNA-binding CsgD family transcriptional regulator